MKARQPEKSNTVSGAILINGAGYGSFFVFPKAHASLLIVPSGTTDTLARRTCLFRVGVPVVPAQSIGYLRGGTKALIRNLLKFTAAEQDDGPTVIELDKQVHLSRRLRSIK